MTSHPNRSKRKHGHAIGFDPELCLGCMREQRDELLAALIELIPFVKGDIGKRGIKACDRAEAAIANARGE